MGTSTACRLSIIQLIEIHNRKIVCTVIYKTARPSYAFLKLNFDPCIVSPKSAVGQILSNKTTHKTSMYLFTRAVLALMLFVSL